MVRKEDSSLNVEEKHVEEWNFRLGGKYVSIGKDDLQRAFKVNEDQYLYLNAEKEEKDRVWKIIIKKNIDYKHLQNATQIGISIWKFAHRFIANCIYLRTDGGPWVTSHDLELICCMYKQVKSDPLIVITKALEEHNSTSFKGYYNGGGHFVSMIATFVRFLLDQSKSMPKRTLVDDDMVYRGLLKVVPSPAGR